VAEPHITEIASYLATTLPEPGSDPAVARDGWRRAIRLARELGDVRWLTDVVARQAPQDATLQAHCDALRR
jgi:hypothetical protein